ncbi:uncharacterized protein PV09_00674 [Verruconis gallopava]|uniref:FAD-dependent oxidoreductase 2 FAD-binding domain-containing protein n=1 Tax=Verruconis gallopava TaxID=253628 RepID=A0A0D2APW1_9PEZI|nr:uncharacterized protein PV09_00674 [Verruconis gallopava]KIW08733.1 hypothetical protein PV09_00674 [Verruconis gallopava]
MSGGVVYAGGGTKQQMEASIHDTPENMFNYLKLEVGDAVSDSTLRRFCNESTSMLEWLEKHGAKFEGSLCPWKCSYPTDQYYLYYSGNEKAHPFNRNAQPAARGHRFVKPGLDSGSGLWKTLTDSAQKLNVQFKHLCHIESIIMENGRFQGLRALRVTEDHAMFARHKKLSRKAKSLIISSPKRAAKLREQAEEIYKSAALPETIKAKSVVLAAGGFAFNREWVNKFAPQYKNTRPLGSGNDLGFGIRLGQSAGGTTSHMDRFTCWRFLTPPSTFLRGVAVGLNGKRIAAEDQYGATFSEALIHDHGGRGYLILDSEQWREAKARISVESTFPMNVPALWSLYWKHARARSLEKLAKIIGVPADVMNETIQAYNDGVRSESGDPYFKNPEYCSPISKPPFYAIDISIRDSALHFATGLSLGGLRVDEESGSVLSDKGTTIPGVYAAGRNAVGLCSNRYISGLSLADCVFSGRRAGKHAALAARSVLS